VSKNKAAWQSLWLISARARGGMRVFIIDIGSERVLPVFSFQEECESFLHSEALAADWWPRQTTAGELVSLLSGLSARVDKVALDPLPGLGEREIVELVSTRRRYFVRHLMGEVAAHSARKIPPGRETGCSDPTRLWKGRTRPARSVARQ
jgi:hypothetical protein